MGLGLAGILVTAAALAATARYEASAPGSDLKPVGGAGELVSLVQDHQLILWKAIESTVASHEVIGWPASDGVHELGGAMVVTRPDNGAAGSINTSEPPRSVEFTLHG